MKKTLKNILFVTIPMLLVLFLLLEIISRIFFPGSDVPKTIYDEKDGLVKYSREYGKRGTWTKGNLAQQRGRWRINNDGWNSAIDYTPEKKPGVTRVAVIGDSYIEAWQVDAEKNYPALLGKSLGDKYEVYSFGVSGSPLSQYLHVSRYVEQKYSPDIYIFNLVHNDFHESIKGLAYIPQYMTVQMDNDSTFTEVKPVKPERTHNKVPGGIVLRKSSLFRYLYYNLNLMDKFRSKKAGAKEVEMNVAVSDVVGKQDSLRAVTKYVLGKIKTELGNKQVLIVMDGPRRNIYNGDLEQSKVKHLNTMVDSLTRQLSLPLIDLTPYMMKDYQQNKKRFETDYDNHWGEYGHEFAASVLYQYFKNNKL
jgi:hypothetical protein